MDDGEDQERQQAIAVELDERDEEDDVQVTVESPQRAGGRPQAPTCQQETQHRRDDHQAEITEVQVGFAEIRQDASLDVVLAT